MVISMFEYAVYDKDETLVLIGTHDEVTKFCGLKNRQVLHSTVSRQANGKRQYTRSGYKIVALGETNEEVCS